MNEARPIDHIVVRIGDLARLLAVLSVIFVLAAGAIAKAQSPITAPTNNSERGLQSVITQSRDSLQRRMSTGKPQQQDQSVQQQHAVKKPDLQSSDQK